MDRFEPGAAVVVRHVIFGRPYSVWPQRVVADDGHELAVLLQPGTNGLGPALWIQAMREEDPAARAAFLPALAAQECEVGDWTWRRTTMLAFCWPDRYFSVNPIWADDRFVCWYVNFQIPYQRTTIGADTSDLHLDLEVFADFSYRWKDEDEYAHARDLGLVTDRCHKRVEEARGQALAMMDARQAPFVDTWIDWRPDPTWTVPQMPDGAYAEPAAEHLRGLPE
jgi:predicted RNA-binding protein associated with RNAse of E/G family